MMTLKTKTQKKHAAVMELPLRGPLIFVVDDDPEILMIIDMSLDDLVPNQRVVIERDPLLALQRIIKETPELVVTDLAMPGLDGAALARAVASNPRLSGTRIIGVTGMTESDVRETALDSGITELVLKPFSPQELRASACRALGITKNRRGLSCRRGR